MGWYNDYKPYVPVARRRAEAKREVERRNKKGQSVSPIEITGLKIATTFWGKAWCTNLESYSDFSNRLPRGRTYVRNGSVVDLQINPTKITALVSGSELYEVSITIAALRDDHWKKVKSRCAGEIGTLVELLQGKLSRSVMDVVTQRDGGLFPKPAEIEMSCSCPDWAGMCKHVAATMYGVGARFDQQPELLFLLRKVDHLELLQTAGLASGVGAAAKRGKKTLAASDLADMFGIELSESAGSEPVSSQIAKPVKPTRRKSAVATRPAEAMVPVSPVDAAVESAPRASTRPRGRPRKSAAAEAEHLAPVADRARAQPAKILDRGPDVASTPARSARRPGKPARKSTKLPAPAALRRSKKS